MKRTDTEEKRKHSSKLIPYSYYDGNIPKGFPEVPMHWHNEFEMNYIVKGSGEFICGDDHFISRAGDIIILPPDMLHAIHTYEDCEQVYHTLVFSHEMLGGNENDRCAVECVQPIVNGTYGIQMHITEEHPSYNKLKEAVETIFACVQKNNAQYDLLLKSELLRFFWIMEISGDIYRKKNLENSRSEAMRPVLEYINENFRENITVEQLAETVHLSKSYFMNRFREAIGVGAVEYVIRKRIQYACEMLIKSNSTIAEIAFESGFRNISNFNRQFGKIVGCTPMEYRKL